MPQAHDIRIGQHDVAPGERRRLEIPITRLPTDTWLSVPVEAVNGAHDGPSLWLSAALHGDELNGVEIIRRVLDEIDVQTLHGAVIAVPIVNVFGFLHQSRYLPDRRDLNRSFPGSTRGSLASRLAHLFMTEVVSHCQYGIDLHTGSDHRTNLPHIRANLHDAQTRRCAEAFAAPVMMHAETRDGSLREAATALGIHVLLYEAGEAMRFDGWAIDAGVRGVLGVLAKLRMVKKPRLKKPAHPHRPSGGGKSIEVTAATWVRARHSGILHLAVELGQEVAEKQELGVIHDAFGQRRGRLRAPHAGLVIGQTNNPLVNRGDAAVHLARRV